jgi:hypothetical protein
MDDPLYSAGRKSLGDILGEMDRTCLNYSSGEHQEHDTGWARHPVIRDFVERHRRGEPIPKRPRYRLSHP